ncbi:hypothetical protein P3T73_00790 [Kiritimatiellota bacterium B12222]|nr:hypothetical protein P3T73_00790 [Kiritimatiellota bacterium B12222]
MSKRFTLALFSALMVIAPATSLWAQNSDTISSIGFGASYYTAIDDLSSDIDDNGFSYMISYQYRPGILGLELNAELLPEIFNERGFAPSAYVILGKTLYVAAGIGILSYDGNWANDPYYAFKAGLNLPLSKTITLDIFGNYQFSSKIPVDDAVDDIDTDTIFLGAALRFGF